MPPRHPAAPVASANPARSHPTAPETPPGHASAACSPDPKLPPRDPPSASLRFPSISVPHPLPSTSPARLRSPTEFPASPHPSALSQRRTSRSSRRSRPALPSTSPPRAIVESPLPPTSPQTYLPPAFASPSSRQTPPENRPSSLSPRCQRSAGSACPPRRKAPQSPPTESPSLHP